MNDNTFDEFLQDATLAVHDMWTKAGGRELTTDELRQLNDAVTWLFSSKRADL